MRCCVTLRLTLSAMYASLSSKRVLITGATGFIGGHLVRSAQALGWEVWIAIRPASDRKRAEALGVRIIELDYADEAGMCRIMQNLVQANGARPWDYVIHNAGLTKTADPREFYEANAEHTRRFASALKASGTSPERFVLISSLSSYGAPAADGVLRATDPQHPTTDYGRSKMLAERYVRESGLAYTILLPTGVYGPGDRDYLMALQSIQRGINFMAGLKTQHLTFVYGEDVAHAALFVAQDARAASEAYIVADGDTHTDSSFGALACELLGVRRVLSLRAPLPLLWLICQAGSLWAKLSGRITPLNRDKYHLMAQRSWRCDAAPLRALGWSPTHNLRRGLAATIAAARAQGLLR